MLRPITGVVGYVVLFGSFLFLPAGTLHWGRAWVLLGVLLALRMMGTLSLAGTNRELLVERSKLPIHRDQPFLDKVLLLSFMAAFSALIAFTALDRFHVHLLPRPGLFVSALGLLLFMAGWGIVSLTLRTNAFAATVVRYQEERQHAVVDTGVYGIVRHPMYAGLVAVLVGTPLWLESYAAALAANIPIGILVLRIILEERFLRRKLRGYDSYMSRVPRRLIPGLW